MRNEKIPFVDLRTQYQRLQPELDDALANVLARGDFILGEEVRLFEQEFAAFCRAQYCVAVANGTDALHLSLLACGITVSVTSTCSRLPMRLFARFRMKRSSRATCGGCSTPKSLLREPGFFFQHYLAGSSQLIS